MDFSRHAATLLRFAFVSVFIVNIADAARTPSVQALTGSSLREKQWPQCPYDQKIVVGTENLSQYKVLYVGGESPYECHAQSEGKGNTCPELQQARLKSTRQFFASNYHTFLDSAKSFPLKPIFDKTEKVYGLETYEEMLQVHVQGLTHPDVVQIEDKIMLKDLTARAGVPATKMYFGAHKSDWSITKFKRMLGTLCLTGVDSFIIKAVHLAWSQGQKIVRGWQKDCPFEGPTNTKIAALADFVDKEIINARASEAEQHLNLVEPGVIVEELFKTGGHSKAPLEAKVQTLWGKVHHMYFVGDDPRGCKSFNSAWSYNGDKTGWDLKGMRGEEGNDEVGDLVAAAFDGISRAAEKFVAAVGAEVMRVDFFLGFKDDGSVEYKLNEVESISGSRYWHERDGMGRAWVDGYVLSDRVRMTPSKWDKVVHLVEDAKAANDLD